MTKTLSAYLFILFFMLISCKTENKQAENSYATYQSIKDNFESPPSEYGVNCYWWWLNGNVTKGAITKDLEAMKSRNFHGAMIFDAGGHNQRGNKDIPQGPLFGSDEWIELFAFAMDEAKRLGLTMSFNIQSGWNLGGPRVTPQHAAKQITYSETLVSGGNASTIKLDLPPIRNDYYHDIAVLAIPVNDKNKSDETIAHLNLKLGFQELGGSAPDTRFLLTNDGPQYKEGTFVVSKDEIVNLTSKMDEEGNLTWEVPDGKWDILRFGYTSTDARVSTSSGDWQGYVLDYMSKDAFDFYWNDVVAPIFDALGDHVGTTLKFLETDSWECGGMNWTDNFSEEFKNYRGYDLLDYLPISAGYIVNDVKTTNAFLADFRKTLGDLVAYNHYARFAEYAHKHNLGIQPESAGPHAGPLDGIKNYGFSDIVMSEFWSPSPHRPTPEHRYFVKQASSAAHIYGKKIVGAEAFTTIGPHWNDELWHDQKPSFDHELCAGVNRIYFHTFTISPTEMGLPGQEYFAGTHVNPQVTWWDQSGPFIDYFHRTQSVVQNGKFVADVLFYYGDHVPNVFPFTHPDIQEVAPNFDYDVTDETIFLQLKMKDGKIVVPGGIEYRVLVLPGHKVLSFDVLKKLESLLKQGAHVIGDNPQQFVGLSGGEKAQKQFKDISNKIWGENISEKGERDYGKGKIVWGVTPSEYLLSQNVAADFNVLGSDNKKDYDYIHYTIGEADVYFVANQTAERRKIDCQFRVSGLQPELWDALTGEIREAQSFTQTDNLTTVPLTFEPYGSIMVVFNKKIDKSMQGTQQQNYPDFETVETIDGEWVVNFDTKWGGPESIVFPELIDWTTHSNEGVKYYSGSAVYNKVFNIDFEPANGEDYFLQLESVKDVGIAQVTINGVDKGVLWTKPFRIDISNELKQGENTLQVKVVNSWYNRVAADEMFRDKKQYTSTNILLINDYRGRPRKEIPLEPSGLIGPVTIEKAKQM